MMTNLIYLPISSRAFGQWSGRRGFRDHDSALHALVTGLFGRGALQPFRYFETGESGSIYGYSTETEGDLSSRMATCATPDVEQVIDGPVKAKPMPKLSTGSRIGFDLKAVPTRRRGNREADAHDVDLTFERRRTREESYLVWLAERLGDAAEIERMRLVRFSKIRTLREKRKVTLPSATLQGTLTVKDEGRFAALLSGGIGRHKAYGYGQLLLRPADPEM